MKVSDDFKGRARINAFFNTSLLTIVVARLANKSIKANDMIVTKKKKDGTRDRVYGARATLIYAAMEKLGYNKNKVKDVLDAMVLKSRFLERELAILVVDGTRGDVSMTEWVYRINDGWNDLVNEAVSHARALTPEKAHVGDT